MSGPNIDFTSLCVLLKRITPSFVLVLQKVFGSPVKIFFCRGRGDGRGWEGWGVGVWVWGPGDKPQRRVPYRGEGHCTIDSLELLLRKRKPH